MNSAKFPPYNSPGCIRGILQHVDCPPSPEQPQRPYDEAAQAEVVVALREDVTGAAHLLTVVNLEVAIADVTLQEGRVGGDEGRVGRGKEGRGEGVCGGNDTVLPGDDVDKPEDEGRRPHVTEIGQGVEEGHISATYRGVTEKQKS